MKKRHMVKLISFFAAFVLIGVGFFIKTKQKNDRYRLRIKNMYVQSLSQICEGLSDINIELKKAGYVTTAEKLQRLSAEIYHDAGLVSAALSQLPANGNDLSAVYKFLAQAGDYTMALAKNATQNGRITSAEQEMLTALSKTAEKLSAAADEMRTDYTAGGEIEFDTPANDTADIDRFGGVRDSISEYPRLVYDGPYSDHILEGESQMLENETEITVGDAKAKAAQNLDITPDKLTHSGDAEGVIMAYRFDTEDTTVAVTKRGGHILYFRKYRPIGKVIYSYEQAVDAAAAWLREHTSLEFKDSYYFADEGVCTVNFAYKSGATVCYSDLIKVGVALDTGEVVLCEANGFIMNHKPRTINTPKHTVEEAATIISDMLTINASQQVLIPNDGKREIACYEFTCTDRDGQEVLVYINQETLVEEKVFLVLKTPGGTLTK